METPATPVAELTSLKKDVESYFGIIIETKNDYDRLRKAINGQLKDNRGSALSKDEIQAESISTITLMRIWGYVEYKNKDTKTRSLPILARSIGYTGWQDYCEHIKQAEEQSSQKEIEIPLLEDPTICINPQYINVLGLEKLHRLILGWHPYKYCIIEFLGDFEFKIIETKGLKKKAGDIFYAQGFSLTPIQENNPYPDIRIDPFYHYYDDPDYNPTNYNDDEYLL